MAGSFDWDGGESLLSWPAMETIVCRYSGGGYFRLPNVTWTQVNAPLGADPPAAQFRYVMDDAAVAQGYPSQVEELWPIDAHGPYVVQPDDRLVILGILPNGGYDLLFDGFAQIPRASVGPNGQDVHFTAVGVAARCFDRPIGGRTQRDGNDAISTSRPGVRTDLPTRFNPTDHEGVRKSNCTGTNYDYQPEDELFTYPMFLDPDLVRSPSPTRPWTLEGAVRYILAVENDEQFVANPDFGDLTAILKARVPVSGDTYNPGDSSTYDATDIVLRDYDATNKPWPEALEELLGYAGFAFRWEWGLDGDGFPKNVFRILRIDKGSTAAPKVVWMDAQGSDIDPARNTVTNFNLARDMNGIVNAFQVETKPRRIEGAFVLAPGFSPDPADIATPAARQAFQKSKLRGTNVTTEALRKYRYYVLDEAGDGHWDHQTDQFVPDTAPDLSGLFPAGGDGAAGYVARLRPGRNTLISLDASKRPLAAVLHYSQDYEGTVPGVWDGTGTWKPVSSGWKPLHDRLGIEVTVEDPEQWGTGKDRPDLLGITWQADPDAGKRFFLRFTTVIDDDLMLSATATARSASPTRYQRLRRVSARDHFEMLQVHRSSPYFVAPDGGGNVAVIRDDTEQASTHARLLRAAHEMPKLAGSISMPGFPSAILPGDFVSRIRGREVSLGTSAGSSQGEAPRYPVCVSVQWINDQNGQHTTLQLADRRGEPQRA